MRNRRLSGTVVAFVAALLSFGAVASVAQQPAGIDDVILLAQSDLTDDTILVFLDYREIGFQMGSAEVSRLRQGGVSEGVIRYLIERSAAPVAPAPVVTADAYPTRYYATYFGAAPAFYGGADYYPSWWWNDYYYLHFSPWHSYSGGHHLYAGLDAYGGYGGYYGGYGGHSGGYGGHFGGYGGHYGGYSGHTTYGYRRAAGYSRHYGSGTGQLGAGGSYSTHRDANSGGHRAGSSFGGSHSGSVRHSSSRLGSMPTLRHSTGSHSSRGARHGSRLNGRHSGGGHSGGGHSGGGHSGGGHSGGGHN